MNACMYVCMYERGIVYTFRQERQAAQARHDRHGPMPDSSQSHTVTHQALQTSHLDTVFGNVCTRSTRDAIQHEVPGHARHPQASCMLGIAAGDTTRSMHAGHAQRTADCIRTWCFHRCLSAPQMDRHTVHRKSGLHDTSAHHQTHRPSRIFHRQSASGSGSSGARIIRDNPSDSTARRHARRTIRAPRAFGNVHM